MRCKPKLVAVVLASTMLAAVAQAGDCETLLLALGTPTFATQHEATYGYADREVLVRTEQARLRLLGMGGAGELDGVCSRALAKLDSCHWSMEAVSKLDSIPPDIEGLAKAVSEPGLPQLAPKTPIPGR